MQMLISNKDVLIAIMEVDSSKNKSISRLILTQGWTNHTLNSKRRKSKMIRQDDCRGKRTITI